MPSTGTRRASASRPANGPTPPASPTRRLLITREPVDTGLPALRSPREPRYLRGEDVALVRPYYVRFEEDQERRRQRDRRTALFLATVGIDFQGASA
ncbi:hypothetical protein ADL06_29695 [Streptomyces sp. NRRL F-6491]|nr:hypothetical protein ADL06_29695 [Streptomyces sp. NRRL F-6491]KOX37558.1 hypothetical protein ADL08_29800 [Streptomyces sp. NRRL F-6492]